MTNPICIYMQLMVHVSLAKYISGARLDSNDYKYGWNQAISDGQNSINGTDREITACAIDSRDIPIEYRKD